MTSSPTLGHGPWGQESWNESQPSRVPMVQIWMLYDEWLVEIYPTWETCTQLCEKLCRKFHERDGCTNERTNIRTERRKLYTPQHKCWGIIIWTQSGVRAKPPNPHWSDSSTGGTIHLLSIVELFHHLTVAISEFLRPYSQAANTIN